MNNQRAKVRCKYGKEMLGIYGTYEKVKEKTLCSGIVYVKK